MYVINKSFPKSYVATFFQKLSIENEYFVVACPAAQRIIFEQFAIFSEIVEALIM